MNLKNLLFVILSIFFFAYTEPTEDSISRRELKTKVIHENLQNLMNIRSGTHPGKPFVMNETPYEYRTANADNSVAIKNNGIRPHAHSQPEEISDPILNDPTLPEKFKNLYRRKLHQQLHM